MKPKRGDKAEFKTYSGLIIKGYIYAISDNCYIVIGIDCSCAIYSDSLFRFSKYQFIKVIK